MLIAQGAIDACKIGVAVALRYGAARPQFGDKLIIEYLTHQRRLMPGLASTYAHHLAMGALKDVFCAKRPEDAKLIHVLSSGLKAAATWSRVEVGAKAAAAVQGCFCCCRRAAASGLSISTLLGLLLGCRFRRCWGRASKVWRARRPRLLAGARSMRGVLTGALAPAALLRWCRCCSSAASAAAAWASWRPTRSAPCRPT
jgi:hypothetical protein